MFPFSKWLVFTCRSLAGFACRLTRLALANSDSAAVIVAVIAEQYMRHEVAKLSDKQRRHVCEKLADFCNQCGTKPVRKLKKFDLTSWLDSHPTWGDWARRGAAAAIKRALNWGVVR